MSTMAFPGGFLRGAAIADHFMDHFEWAFGYTRCFGSVCVHYDTRRRILKRSAEWYAESTRANVVGE